MAITTPPNDEDNYDRWGQGQAYDEAWITKWKMSMNVKCSIQKQLKRDMVDMMRADADHLDLDARSYEQDAHEINKSA